MTLTSHPRASVSSHSLSRRKALSRIPEKPVAIDLFAGCGALSLGLRRAGFHVAAAVEINFKRADTYRANHPRTAILQKDIREVSATELLAAGSLKPNQVALVAGCPPCQGFSRIRRRNSKRAVRDERNDLPAEFGRLVRAIRPRAIMMENVPGLEKDKRFTTLLRSLRGAGYRLTWGIVDLANYGVPQRRKRLVLVGWRGPGTPDLNNITAGPFLTVRDVLQRLPQIPRAAIPLHRYRVPRSLEVKSRIRNVPRNGGSRGDLPKELSLRCHLRESKLTVRSPGFRDVYGRMAWDEPAPTITGGCVNPSKGRFLHPVYNRSISILEAARLQTFPIWYRFNPEHGRYPIAEMIGEALPPRFAYRMAKYLKEKIATRDKR